MSRPVAYRRDDGRPAARTVTVVMPVVNEAEHIEEAIASILANEAEWLRVEVLVVDGMSTDGTREIVERLGSEDDRVRLLDNPSRTVPFALNKGIAEAAGEVIIRVDGHAAVASDFIENCLAELDAHPECGCVGGPITNVDSNEVSRAISHAMSSKFGVGNARFRLGEHEGYVDTLAFGAYRREVFERVGRFDEVLTRNQDDEFNYRLTRSGSRIWMSPRIRSRYYVRSSFRKLFRQYYQYGFWKVYVNRKHGTVTSLRQLVPVAFVSALAGLLAMAPFLAPARLGLTVLLGAYLAAGAGFALAKTREPLTLVRIVAAFALLHLGYGLGYLEGIYRFYLLGVSPGMRNAELSR